MRDKWYVEKTPCYPAEWKVRTARWEDNATCNYFWTRAEAQAEADRRNASPTNPLNVTTGE